MHTQAEKALKIKHMIRIIRDWDLIEAFSNYLKHEHLIRQERETKKRKNKIQLTKACFFEEILSTKDFHGVLWL